MSENVKYITIHVPVSPELSQEIDRMASISDMKKGTFVRMIVSEYVKQNKDYYNQLLINRLFNDNWFEDPKERHKKQIREWARKNRKIAKDPSKPSQEL